MPSLATAKRRREVASRQVEDPSAADTRHPPLTLVSSEPGVDASREADEAGTGAVDEDTDPLRLWNPHVAALLSLVFTPVFGAWLHHRNAAELGDQRLGRVARMWLVVALAFTASGLYLVSAGQLAPTSAFSASALLSGYTIVWYAFAGYKQSRVIARLGSTHWQARGFVVPVAVATLLMALPALIVWVRRLH